MAPKRKKDKAGYFDNEEMLNLLKERNSLKEKESSKETDLLLKRVENKIGLNLFRISERMMHRPNFCNYDSTTKSEMISDAVFNCLKASDRYDVNYPNPFGYFTQITWNAFILNIKAMQKRTEKIVNINHLDNLCEGSDDPVGD